MENLLSKNDKEVLKRGYHKRLIIVWCWLVVLALPIFLVLTAPVYIAAGLKLSEIQDRNKVNEAANTEDTGVFSLPDIIDKKSGTVLNYRSVRGAYPLIRSALEAAPAGLSVGEVAFDRSTGKKGDELRITGVAKDRETLFAYQQALKEGPGVTSVIVPVESFSRPTDLNFSVNVSISTSTNPQP